MKHLLVIPLLCFALNAIHAFEGKRTLVLLENLTLRETHSFFFRSLKGKVAY